MEKIGERKSICGKGGKGRRGGGETREEGKVVRGGKDRGEEEYVW